MLAGFLNLDKLFDNLGLGWFRMAIRVNFDLYRNTFQLIRDWFSVEIVYFKVVQWTDPEILTTVVCEMLRMINVKPRYS